MKALSEQTIEALAQVISGGSANDQEPPVGVYRTGEQLRAWFKFFDIPIDLGAGSRVAATRTALHFAAFVDSTDLMKSIVERAADPRDFLDDPQRQNAVVEYLNRRLMFDDLHLEISGKQVHLLEVAAIGSVVAELFATATSIDFDTVNRDLDRALDHADVDPELAVTGACSLLESVCHSILVELEAAPPAKQDIAGLYRALRDPLGLSPTKDGIPPEIANDVKAVLSGLVTTVQSIGALRTHAGSAHGKRKGHQRIDPRIAKLAIHAASAVALFLIETWQAKFPGRNLPSRSPQ
jgi:hypothetical protein